MDADLDTLATELYVWTDDLLKAAPERVPWRPDAGISPKVSDAELGACISPIDKMLSMRLLWPV